LQHGTVPGYGHRSNAAAMLLLLHFIDIFVYNLLF